MYPIYNLVAFMAAPFGAAWLCAHPQHRPLLARFAPQVPTHPCDEPFWVHACSVGEIGVASPIIRAMNERWPSVPILLTVSTASGHELASRGSYSAMVAWLPFDVRRVVHRFVRQVNPRALLLIETELWPNVMRETRRHGAPVVLINGRLSDKHLARYRRFARLYRPVVAQLSAAGMQNEEYAARLVAMGADRFRVRVTGNTKFDGVATSADPLLVAWLREENDLPELAPVLLFGSTRPGDEALAAACWKVLRDEFPHLRLIIAPRHLDRLADVIAVFDEPLLLRSEVRNGRRPAGERVFVLDTVGELATFYALADVAVIGGSFYPGVNGHNPLEPAALGVPTVFGPYMRNFIDPANELLAYGGAWQATDPAALLPGLRRLLADPQERMRMAASGKTAVLANQGAIARTLDLLESVLDKRRA